MRLTDFGTIVDGIGPSYERELYIAVSPLLLSPMATKKCPVCGVAVKVENLERHVKNQHPRDRVETEQLLTQEERRTVGKSKTAGRPALTSAGKRNIAILAVVVAAVLIGAIYFGLSRGGTNPGQTAPNFTLPTTTTGSVTLSSLRGAPVLLEFMDVDCPYCQQESGTLSSLYSNYTSRGVQFLSVDMNSDGATDTADRINSFKVLHNTPWTYVMDPSSSVAGTYGVTATPTMFVLDRNGVVAQEIVGAKSYATLAAALDSVLGG